MTRGNVFLQAMTEALASLRRLSHGPYERSDVAGIIDPLGSRLESFLRSTVLPGSSRKDNLFDLIAALASAGLPQTQAGAIDTLRLLYNRSKHRPLEGLPLGEVVPTVEKAAEAVSDLIALGVGTVHIPYERELNYHLYVAFWDHYTGGETEIVVSLPSDHWTHVALVDTFSMKIGRWDELKILLIGHPQFRLGKENFAAEVWTDFEAEGDFLNAGVWDGDYGELIRLIAPFNDRSIEAELIPQLARTNNSVSVATALIVAAIDVARVTPTQFPPETLADAIICRAAAEYAMPKEGRGVPAKATQLAALIQTIAVADWGRLVGPVLTATHDGSTPTSAAPLPIRMDGNAIVLEYR